MTEKPRTGLIGNQFSASLKQNTLLMSAGWRPFPSISDRRFWQSVPQGLQEVLSALGRQAADKSWPTLPASTYLEFSRTGSRAGFESRIIARREILRDLVLAECLSNQGEFIAPIADAIWQYCEESSWVLPAHMFMQAAGPGLPDHNDQVVDLGVGQTASALTWAYYLLGEPLNAYAGEIGSRLGREIQARLLIPCLERDDFWWLGEVDHPIFAEKRINNWTSWICAAWLPALLLFEQNPGRQKTGINKLVQALDRFVDEFGVDGGAREGPAYWRHGLFGLLTCLEALTQTTGIRLSGDLKQKISNMGEFIVHAHIGDDHYINFADASAMCAPPAALVTRLGRLVDSERLIAFGSQLARRQGLLPISSDPPPDLRSYWLTDGKSLLDALHALCEFEPGDTSAKVFTHQKEKYYPSLQLQIARGGKGNTEELFFCAKGGCNADSHNHNDVGSFIFYQADKPLFIDVGVGTYTQQTFSDARYQIWTMQSDFHNLPTIGGAMQSAGRDCMSSSALNTTGNKDLCFDLDLKGAYPDAEGLQFWHRSFRFDRARKLVIKDSFLSARPLNPVILNFMTPSVVDLCSPGVLSLSSRELGNGDFSGQGVLHFDADRFRAEIQDIPLSDPKLSEVWGDCIFRIRLHLLAAAKEAQFVTTLRAPA